MESAAALANRKQRLRRRIIALRNGLPPEARALRSRRITEVLSGTEEYRNAKTVMLYWSVGSEFQTEKLARAVLAQGKTLVLPRANAARDALEIYAVTDLEASLAPGAWNIPEPRPERCAPVDPASLDWVLAPGVAFTATGERLGYGGGFYDCFLGRLAKAPFVAAAAFAIQVVADLPLEPTDRRVDMLVTEDAVYRISKNGS